VNTWQVCLTTNAPPPVLRHLPSHSCALSAAVSLKPLAPVLVRYTRGAMLGWMHQYSARYSAGEGQRFASTTMMAVQLAGSMSDCIQASLTILQMSVHISDEQPNHASDQFEPVTVQLGRSTTTGHLAVPVKLLRAATDRQHLSEWLEAADCAATAIVTLLGSVTLRSDYISGMPKWRP
jgi:hypothetical protein